MILLVFLGLILVYSGFLSLLVNTGFAASHETGFDFWGGVGWWIEKAGLFGILATIILYWLQQRSDRRKERTERRENT